MPQLVFQTGTVVTSLEQVADYEGCRQRSAALQDAPMKERVSGLPCSFRSSQTGLYRCTEVNLPPADAHPLLVLRSFLKVQLQLPEGTSAAS